jgi:hypothetical protein
MVRALVTGGYYDDGGDGVVWLVDFTRGQSEVLVRWAPAPSLRVPTKGFAGGSRATDGTLYVAAHASVVRVDVDAGRVTGVLHHPSMNDLHHVAALDGRLYISNTGLGAVDVIEHDGTFIGSHAFLPAWVNTRRMNGADPPDWDTALRTAWSGDAPSPWTTPQDGDAYYASDRGAAPFHQLKVRDYLHINHVARVGNRTLATCFGDGSLRDLANFKTVWRQEGAFLHDGVAHGDGFWLTAIDGTLIELDATTFTERKRLSAFDAKHHGWCRGLAVTNEHLVVGLTEVRRARLPRHRWAEHDPDTSETSVLLLDRDDGRLLARVDLTDRARHSKLYSVILLPEGAS